MKLSEKTFTILLVIALVFTLLPTTVLATVSEPFIDNGIKYQVLTESGVTGTAGVIASVDPYSGDITIPSTVDYNGVTYTVTSISNGAFAYCGTLTSVSLPVTVTGIGDNAFKSCTSLTTLTIPGSVTYIGDNAFYQCSQLNPVTIPGVVTYIGAYAFFQCSLQTSLVIPEGVAAIKDYTFSGCSQLTSMNIPSSVTSIGKSAFESCPALKSVTFEAVSQLETIGESAFTYCTALELVTIPDSVTSISRTAFASCTELASVTFGSGSHLASIGEAAFSFCYLLDSVNIPDNVTGIGAQAFYDCTALASVTIPASATTVDDSAFTECASLASLTISGTVDSTLTVVNGTVSGIHWPDLSVALTTTTPPEKQFDHWTTSGGGSFDNPNSTIPTFSMPNDNVTVTALSSTIPVAKTPVPEQTVTVNGTSSFTASDIAQETGGDTYTIFTIVRPPFGATATASLSEGTVTITGVAAGSTFMMVAVSNLPAVAVITVPITTAPSSDAGLTSVLGQAITAGAEAGTSGAPKTASISVANAVSTVAATNIVKHDAGATVTFYGTDSTFATPAVGGVNLTAGSRTIVYIKVVAADSTTLYYKVTINRASAHSSGGSTPATPPPSADTGVEILVNGKTETAATATTAQEGDQTVTTVVVDDKKIEEKLQAEGNNATVTIPVKNDSDVIVGQLSGQTVKNMEIKEAVLEIKTENVTYTLPASQINIDNVSEQIGKQVELKDIKVNVAISAPPQDTVKVVEDTANKNNYQVVVKPIEFNITCTSGNKTVDVSRFNGYVERMVAIPDGVDPSKITTGIVLNADGTFSHVPTTIIVINGKYYAKINSLTNSTYSVIYSPKTFKDVEKHWARDAVNDMGSRLVISGVGNGMFEPDRDITRGEFAAIVVRALGLMRPGTGKASFDDVSKNDWYYDAVSIAYENGIISGYGNGKFGPMDKITREQAMTMIARAMKITKLKSDFKASEAEQLLAAYSDSGKASSWAMDSIASCIKTGVVLGRSGKLAAPKDNITRAEVAAIVQRLLQKSNLI